MEIKILGTGCTKCTTLNNLVVEIVKEHNIDANIEKVEDIEKIMEYDVMNTPALVVDNKVLVKGRVPEKAELIKLLVGNNFNDVSYCCGSGDCC